MKVFSLIKFGALVAVALVLGTPIPPVLGQFPSRTANQVDAPRSSNAATKAPPSDDRSLFRDVVKLAKSRLDLTRHHNSPFRRDHPSVLRAFREAVETPGKSTVRVLCHDKQVALGTIVRADGYILTKASQLDGPVLCQLSDRSRYEASVVNTDEKTDLAVLKIRAGTLPVIRWSEDDSVALGAWVASPAPGNLPVAIGVLSARPHRVRGGKLGVQLTESNSGPDIFRVEKGSGAEKAGLMRGDIITHVNGQSVVSIDALINLLTTCPPGKVVGVRIQRQGMELVLSVELGNALGKLDNRHARIQQRLGGPLSKRRVGFPSVLEHDSVLQPEDCGGPLIGLNGQAIGINIARANRISSFTIPADAVRALLPSLIVDATTTVSRDGQRTTVLKPPVPQDTPK